MEGLVDSDRGELWLKVAEEEGGKPFDDADQKHLGEFASPIGVILETWWRMKRSRGTA
jgi:hypothetical protein